MSLLLYISLICTSSLLINPKVPTQRFDLCDIYGSVYVETQNRNRADIVVYADNQSSFPELKVYVQENRLYADRPGMWSFTKDISMADFVIYIEKEEGITRNVISYTDVESHAGCQ